MLKRLFRSCLRGSGLTPARLPRGPRDRGKPLQLPLGDVLRGAVGGPAAVADHHQRAAASVQIAHVGRGGPRPLEGMDRLPLASSHASPNAWWPRSCVWAAIRRRRARSGPRPLLVMNPIRRDGLYWLAGLPKKPGAGGGRKKPRGRTRGVLGRRTPGRWATRGRTCRAQSCGSGPRCPWWRSRGSSRYRA